MIRSVLAENAILRIIGQNREIYTTFTDLYGKASWFVDRGGLLGELDRLVKCRHIRIRGVNAELYIRITGAGIAFLAGCAKLP